MEKRFLFFVLIAGLSVITSCVQPEAEYEEHVFGVQLVDEPEMIQKYLEYHEQVWPEVEAGFVKAGYKNIRLYRFGNFITMIIDVPKGADMQEMGQISNDSSERATEWNQLMSTFQRGLPGTAEGQTWVEMEKYYEFDNF